MVHQTTVEWGRSLWLVLTDSHIELAGTGDVHPIDVSSDDLAALRALQRGDTGPDVLGARLQAALGARGVRDTPASDTSVAPLIVGDATGGPPSSEDDHVSWTLRQVFWMIDGDVLGWSRPDGGLVRLSDDQISVLPHLRKGASVRELTAHRPELFASLGGLAAHGMIHLVHTPRHTAAPIAADLTGEPRDSREPVVTPGLDRSRSIDETDETVGAFHPSGAGPSPLPSHRARRWVDGARRRSRRIVSSVARRLRRSMNGTR